MCISPRQIVNPYWTSAHYKPVMRYISGTLRVRGEDVFGDSGFYMDNKPNVSPIIKETKDLSRYIDVPCGSCPQCRSRRQSDLLQRVQMESLSSYLFMFTLTYNYNVPKYSLPNGKVLMRADYKHIVDMFKRIRKQDYFKGRQFKYLVCSEYAPKHARPHFHGILFLKKLPSDSRLEYVTLEKLAFETILKEWRVNVATRIALKDSKKYKAGDVIPDTRRPKYLPLLDYHKTFRNGEWHSTYDLHYITPNSEDGTNDVSYYVMKYLFKEGNGEKFVQACCYKSLQSKKSAMALYQKELKSQNHKSLNLGCAKDDGRRFIKREQFNNEYWPDRKTLDYILECVKISKANNLPLSFFDIYTGKRMPMCDYYAKMLPLPMQLEFAKDMRRRIDTGELRELTEESYKQAMNKYKLQTKRTFVTDVFDDDDLFNVLHLDDDMPDFDKLSSDAPDSDELGSYVNNKNIIEPSYEDWCGDLPKDPYVPPKLKVTYYEQLSLNLS